MARLLSTFIALLTVWAMLLAAHAPLVFVSFEVAGAEPEAFTPVAAVCDMGSSCASDTPGGDGCCCAPETHEPPIDSPLQLRPCPKMSDDATVIAFDYRGAWRATESSDVPALVASPASPYRAGVHEGHRDTIEKIPLA